MTTAAEREAKLAKFKYCSGCAQIENCPPERYEPRAGTWFRLVYETIDVNSFLPPYEKSPKRLLDKPGDCSNWALSFYITNEKARAQHKYLASFLKDKVDTLIGSHIASVTVNTTDGICSTPSKKSGHIDLHEFAGARLEAVATMMGPAR